MKAIIEKWKEILFITAIVAAAWNFYGLKTSAQEASQKVIQFEQTFQKIAEIAEDLKDPSSWLRNYLINHGIDSLKAKAWSQFPQGTVLDSLNNPVLNIPFLSKPFLPDLGIFMYIENKGEMIEDSIQGIFRIHLNRDTLILDTLWDFRKECK